VTQGFYGSQGSINPAELVILESCLMKKPVLGNAGKPQTWNVPAWIRPYRVLSDRSQCAN